MERNQEKICEACMDGDIEPDCEYFGEPDGCNSPLHGRYPKVQHIGGMIEAFKSVLKVAEEMRGTYNIADSILKDGWATQLEAIANRALAFQLRNCDVGTEAEQAKRRVAYCEERICKD